MFEQKSRGPEGQEEPGLLCPNKWRQEHGVRSAHAQSNFGVQKAMHVRAAFC